MSEPEVLDQIIECPDCKGTGEQEREYAGQGPISLEPTSIIESCDCCGGAGEVSLRQLEVKS